MSAPQVTVVGRLVNDPELKFVPSGAAVCTFTVAANDSYKKDGQWVEKDAVFLRATVWREAAENAAESLSKGDEVIVIGKLSQNSYNDREGNSRTVIGLDVQSIGPSLRNAVARVERAKTPEKVGW